MRFEVQHACRRGCDSHQPGEFYTKKAFRSPFAAIHDLRKRRRQAWASKYRLKVTF